jgi:gas vesicle protein
MSTSRFLAGAVVGVVIGLLIAPESGEELRTDIADTAGKWRNRLNKLVGKADATLDDLKAYLDNNIDGLTDDVKRKILSILDDAEQMAYNAERTLKNGVL